MANLKVYKEALGLSSLDEILQAFRDSLLDTNKSFSYFVDWQKIRRNVEGLNVEINILNSLIGSKNIKADLSKLLSEYPEVLHVFPLIIAVREQEIKLIDDSDNLSKTFYFKKQKQLTKEDIKAIIHFCDGSGILDLFADIKIKNLKDYLLGVEVGMDTNARKNRSGFAMELAVKPTIEALKKDFPSIDIEFQKTFKFIGKKYNAPISQNLANRKSDFVIRKGNTFINIEVNYFDGQGSKPQEIVDSYINRQNELFNAGWKFIWITDGQGWKDGTNQIKKGFMEIDYLMNLYFAKRGVLKEIVSNI
ncbi:MAG: type II restriction endonuclease [Nitrospirota bacterium]